MTLFFLKVIKLFIGVCVKKTKFTIIIINEKITRFIFSVDFDHDGICSGNSQRNSY